MSTWVFLLLALGSFHPTDWPSHSVEPPPAVQNLCGSAGAYIAYYAFLVIGQGVFPFLFFTGVCVVLHLFHNQVSDLWMRAIGLVLLSAAFAAAVHHFKPGSYDGFPEGQGGIIGIGAAHFLQHYFSTAGTRLVLGTTLLVGLLLAADDLVLRTPGMVGEAFAHVKNHAPQIRWNFPELPKLPALSRFITRDAASPPLPADSAALRAKPLKPQVEDRRR